MFCIPFGHVFSHSCFLCNLLCPLLRLNFFYLLLLLLLLLAFSSFPFLFALPSIWSSTHKVTLILCHKPQIASAQMVKCCCFSCFYKVAFWTWGVLPIHFWPFSCSWVLFYERSASRYPVHLTSRGHCLLQVLLAALKSQWGYKAMRLWSVYMYT